MNKEQEQGTGGAWQKQSVKPAVSGVTHSVKAENQNQEHNTKKVSLGPNTKR